MAKSCEPGGDPLLGCRVGQRFVLVERLGHGASGTVYKAEHVTLRRQVAVKVLHHELSRDELAVERFRREATSVGDLDNDHIVQIHDFGRTEDGRLYLAMDLLQGESLDQVLRREKRLPIARAVDVAVQVGDALIDAHAMGYVHRDLRPRNVFLTVRRGRGDFVKLLDFGLAKLVEKEGEGASSRLGIAFGEPRYMSPEQARGAPLDRRADLYSLGCIAYEMLVGEPPFLGSKVFDILAQHVEATPDPPRARRFDTPPWLDEAICRMLAKRPEDRFETAHHLVEALRRGAAEQGLFFHEPARRLAAKSGGAQDLARTTRGLAPVPGQKSADKPAPAPPPGVPRAAPARLLARADDSVSGLSAAWYADGEQLAGAGELEPAMKEKLDRARTTFHRETLAAEADDVYLDGRREGGRRGFLALTAALLVAVAVALLSLASRDKGGAERREEPAAAALAAAGREPPAHGHRGAATSPFAKDRAAQLVSSGRAALHDGDIGTAGSHFREARRLDPESAEAVSGLGEIALGQGAAGAAIDYFRRAADLRPQSGDLQVLLGQAYLASGELQEAAASFQRALQLDPDNEAARRGYSEATGRPMQ